MISLSQLAAAQQMIGGIGMLHALGARFFDKNDNLLEPIGKSLIRN